jgi:hypothetical protein
MTYETMEAMLFQRIADLRISEADFARSIARVRNGETGIELNAQYVRMHARLAEVEKLMARMEQIEMVAPLASVSVPQTAALLAA